MASTADASGPGEIRQFPARRVDGPGSCLGAVILVGTIVVVAQEYGYVPGVKGSAQP